MLACLGTPSRPTEVRSSPGTGSTRYGDRNLNTALHTVVQIRIQYQQSTQDSIARRIAVGERPATTSNAAWLATSPATSTAYSKVSRERLDEG